MPDYAQSCIMWIIKDPDIEGYIDNSGLSSDGSFEEHLELVDDEVLGWLAANRMKCNPLCNWAVQETDLKQTNIIQKWWDSFIL